MCGGNQIQCVSSFEQRSNRLKVVHILESLLLGLSDRENRLGSQLGLTVHEAEKQHARENRQGGALHLIATMRA